MNRFTFGVAGIVCAGLIQPANAFVLTLAPVTNTTATNPNPILINGTVTVAPGELFLNPTVMSGHGMPFLSNFSAGFNGSGQQFDPGFLAWNGVGTYTGAILNHQVSANNLGYSGGMPLGLYDSNPLGPGGLAAITLFYIDLDGTQRGVNGTFAIQVVPAPGAAALLGCGGMLCMRRRRAAI